MRFKSAFLCLTIGVAISTALIEYGNVKKGLPNSITVSKAGHSQVVLDGINISYQTTPLKLYILNS